MWISFVEKLTFILGNKVVDLIRSIVCFSVTLVCKLPQIVVLSRQQ